MRLWLVLRQKQGDRGCRLVSAARTGRRPHQAAPTTTIVVVRFTVIRNSCDRSTRRFGLCYYSSCTLHRLVQESIRFLRSPSSPSSPPDTLRRGSLARHSPTSTAAR